jgi:hypothetical protein
MLHRFMEICNDLELSHRFIALKNASIPRDMFGEPQNDILDDDLLLLLLFSPSSWILITLGLPLLGLLSVSSFAFSVDDSELLWLSN